MRAGVLVISTHSPATPRKGPARSSHRAGECWQGNGLSQGSAWLLPFGHDRGGLERERAHPSPDFLTLFDTVLDG